jgi:response regulator RpfG family c-di-GMP phosphodiesterase
MVSSLILFFLSPARLRKTIGMMACIQMIFRQRTEAMSSHRPYRRGKGIKAALQEITKGRGRLYDPKAVDVCSALFGKEFVLPDE